MRHLKIDMSELELAFAGGFEMISYYLDLDTGEVISVSREAGDLLDTIYESYYDEQSQMVNWESAFENERVPYWQRELVNDADCVETGLGVTIIAIPGESSAEGSSDMEAFINTVRSPRLREPLERAISGNEHSAISKTC